MVSVTDIGAGISSLKAAFELAKAVRDIADTTERNSKILDLQRVIMDAQASAIEAREAHAAQIDQIRALETELTRLKEWDAEKKRYELKGLPVSGAAVYMLKPDARGAEPPHWLCPNCYNEGKKAFLNPTGAEFSGKKVYSCATCKGIISTVAAPKWL